MAPWSWPSGSTPSTRGCGTRACAATATSSPSPTSFPTRWAWPHALIKGHLGPSRTCCGSGPPLGTCTAGASVRVPGHGAQHQVALWLCT